MRINKLINKDEVEVDKFYYKHDNWDDWGYKTLFDLYFVDESLELDYLGAVKIGTTESSNTSTNIDDSFEKLSDNYFSVGQDIDYYRKIEKLGYENREFILSALRDIAYNPIIYDNSIDLKVTLTSLVRDISLVSLKNEYRKLALGNSILSDYEFSFGKNNDKTKQLLTFKVDPNSNPPSNIHVLIGRNGVGKTFIIEGMIESILDGNSSAGVFKNMIDNSIIFSNLVSVSFSAFEDIRITTNRISANDKINYSYIGLKRDQSDKNNGPKSTTQLKNEFVKSLGVILRSSEARRLKEAFRELSSDPIFKENKILERIQDYSNKNINDLLPLDDHVEFDIVMNEIFRGLSSGHRIVLLTITRLVETVVEKSLVLLDEPETHLHPPLLSAFTRALSNLLIDRNAVAIIATHSPVILQEVPKNCVWKLSRYGSSSKSERLRFECFGENVGHLTREVFGLEVTDSGYHKIIAKYVSDGLSFDEIFHKFKGQIGLEAQSITRTLIFNRDH
mgnify:CR=1 FL=1